eukprot:CAMPEP_0175283092 /NCGR_PEP_ID=MMETSP0093-20121207/51969_1 /TAXON_ID=311494 /ORGANISM="Alexandrium monilatum, Strain CCMP3105" /LENGTH=37 /DNA_ID= /DNA_START= /DNA_END= /DNA_ORIENTATION=
MMLHLTGIDQSKSPARRPPSRARTPLDKHGKDMQYHP